MDMYCRASSSSKPTYFYNGWGLNYSSRVHAQDLMYDVRPEFLICVQLSLFELRDYNNLMQRMTTIFDTSLLLSYKHFPAY